MIGVDEVELENLETSSGKNESKIPVTPKITALIVISSFVFILCLVFN